VRRILTAAVLLPLFIACVLAKNPAFFMGLVALAAVLGAVEFDKLAKASGFRVFPFAVALLSLGFLGARVWPEVYGPGEVLAAGLTGLMVWGLLARVELKLFLGSVSATIFGALYLGFLLGYTVEMRLEAETGPGLIFFVCLIVWAGDTAAYYVGRSLGKHLLAPSVSPKKTWEGAAANVAAGVLAAAIARWTFLPSLRWMDVVAAGLLVSVVGQFGDLFESAIKRGAAVKDSSSLLPGHGGILDRLDSLIFSGPVFYYYYQVFMR
jgi:phosphatidate cytidylyltransferase